MHRAALVVRIVLTVRTVWAAAAVAATPATDKEAATRSKLARRGFVGAIRQRLLTMTTSCTSSSMAYRSSARSSELVLGGRRIAQTIWNLQHRFEPAAGIKDYDLVYFDLADLSHRPATFGSSRLLSNCHERLGAPDTLDEATRMVG